MVPFGSSEPYGGLRRYQRFSCAQGSFHGPRDGKFRDLGVLARVWHLGCTRQNAGAADVLHCGVPFETAGVSPQAVWTSPVSQPPESGGIAADAVRRTRRVAGSL